MLFNSAAIVAVLASAVSAAPAAPGSNPVLVPGKSWTISDMTRHCADDNSSCKYDFGITTDGKTQHCTIDRHPGKDAPYESWQTEKCNAHSDILVSWGYSGGDAATAFATITVNKGKELAWFGISNINSRDSDKCGEDDFGNLPKSPVYTYN